jgi:hypothetical protein
MDTFLKTAKPVSSATQNRPAKTGGNRPVQLYQPVRPDRTGYNSALKDLHLIDRNKS